MQVQGEQAWRQAIEDGELGVWDLRPLLETVHHSPQWKARLGFPNVDQADRSDFWRCRVHPDDLGAMLQAMRAHTEGNSPSYEARFRLRSNGSGYRLLHSRGRVVERDAQGRVARMVGTMIDLTDRPTSPNGGLVDGARHGVAVQSFTHPFHALLGAISADRAAMQERLIALVEDLLDDSVAQLRRLSSRSQTRPVSELAG